MPPSRILVLGVLILIYLQLSNSSFSIRIEDAGGTVDIQTDMYELSWKKAKTMGWRLSRTYPGPDRIKSILSRLVHSRVYYCQTLPTLNDDQWLEIFVDKKCDTN